MSEKLYVTIGTFYTGTAKEKKTIEAGTDVTAKDLGVDEATCERYVDLGTLAVKPKAAKAPAPGDK